MNLAEVATALRARFDDHARNDLRLDPRAERIKAAIARLVSAAVSGHGPEAETAVVEAMYALQRVSR